MPAAVSRRRRERRHPGSRQSSCGVGARCRKRLPEGTSDTSSSASPPLACIATCVRRRARATGRALEPLQRSSMRAERGAHLTLISTRDAGLDGRKRCQDHRAGRSSQRAPRRPAPQPFPRSAPCVILARASDFIYNANWRSLGRVEAAFAYRGLAFLNTPRYGLEILGQSGFSPARTLRTF